jgi:magnesium chelatase subunit D
MRASDLADLSERGAPTDAQWALRIAAVDPAGIGGVRLRAAAGRTRDDWLAALRAALPAGTPWKQVPSHIGDERLLGGIDLAGTLRSGHLVMQPGVLAQAHGGVVVLAMAERCDAGVAARIAQVVDTGSTLVQHAGAAAALPACIGVVALDEAIADDVPLPGSIAERLGIDLRLVESPARLDLSAIDSACVATSLSPHRADVDRARSLLPHVKVSDPIVDALCEAAQALGIVSLRAPSLAVRVACVAAALDGRRDVRAADAALAARLVLGPRARAWPQPPPDPEDEDASDDHPAAEPEDSRSAADAPGSGDISRQGDAAERAEAMSERLLEAAAVTLPKALLTSIAAGSVAVQARAAAAGRSVGARRSGMRGRPIGSARGALRGGARLDLLATLRSAAPWQTLRRRESPSRPAGFLVRSDDFHVRRFREQRESTTVFAVDASGSQALHRLAETKGAVELLLADCYVRRDRVAVIAFRGTQAQLLLAPTRSLVHARRRLAGLPGGGGTPLASGLVAACELAATIVRDGGTPLLVLLTDGSANVALDGKGGRQQAFSDALAAAKAWARIGVGALLVDTAPRAHAQALALAEAMQARYVALPDADAHLLARTIAVRGANA